MKNWASFCLADKKKIKIAYLVGLALVGVAFLFGFLVGSTKISFAEAIGPLFGGEQTADFRIFAYIRLPRTLSSVFCGASLAVSGVVIQGVLSNRLASPSIIGVNSGAGLAITVCTALGLYGGIAMSAFAFFGSLAAVLTVSIASRKWGASRGTVILIGVALNSLLSAVSSVIVTFIPEVSIMSNDFKIGDFSGATMIRFIPSAVLITIGFIVLLTLSRYLDVLLLGEESAKGLGMNVGAIRVLFLILAALLAGAAVSVAGLLSFVGLIIPNAVRRVLKCDSFHLMLLSALFGGGFVSISDTVSRSVFSPYEIPVGIIMALIGAPFFVFILIRGKGGKRA